MLGIAAHAGGHHGLRLHRLIDTIRGIHQEETEGLRRSIAALLAGLDCLLDLQIHICLTGNRLGILHQDLDIGISGLALQVAEHFLTVVSSAVLLFQSSQLISHVVGLIDRDTIALQIQLLQAAVRLADTALKNHKPLLVGLIEAVVGVGKGKLTIDRVAALILQLSRQLALVIRGHHDLEAIDRIQIIVPVLGLARQLAQLIGTHTGGCIGQIDMLGIAAHAGGHHGLRLHRLIDTIRGIHQEETEDLRRGTAALLAGLDCLLDLQIHACLGGNRLGIVEGLVLALLADGDGLVLSCQGVGDVIYGDCIRDCRTKILGILLAILCPTLQLILQEGNQINTLVVQGNFRHLFGGNSLGLFTLVTIGKAYFRGENLLLGRLGSLILKPHLTELLAVPVVIVRIEHKLIRRDMVLKALNVKPGIVEEPALFHVVIDIGTIEHDLRNLVRLDVAGQSAPLHIAIDIIAVSARDISLSGSLRTILSHNPHTIQDQRGNPIPSRDLIPRLLPAVILEGLTGHEMIFFYVNIILLPIDPGCIPQIVGGLALHSTSSQINGAFSGRQRRRGHQAQQHNDGQNRR